MGGGRGGAYCNKEERFSGMELDPLNDPLHTLEGFLGGSKWAVHPSGPNSSYPSPVFSSLTAGGSVQSWWSL